MLVPSSYSLTNTSTIPQQMNAGEYSPGQKIAQIAVQLSGFYGTYVLEGYDEHLRAWITIDPSGLTDYNTPRSPTHHTRLFWLDLHNYSITRIRLSANHASYYGIPSQISIPIIRTEYNGPNIYLTSASPYNVVLQWSNGGNVAGVTYEVWRETLSATGQVLKDELIVSTTDLSFMTTDQEPGKWYRYRIRAVAGGETSAFTNPIDYHTPPLVNVTPEQKQLVLSWTPVTQGDTYALYLEEDGVWNEYSIIGGSSGQVTIVGLSPNKRYRVRLEQHNPRHTGTPWAIMPGDDEYVAPIWGPPGIPTFSDVSPNSVTVSWDVTGFPAGQIFRLYRNGELIYEGPETSYTDTSVSSGVEYRYKVTAINVLGINGVFSPEASVIPQDSLPSTPQDTPSGDSSGNQPGTPSDSPPGSMPIPADGKLSVEGARLVDYSDGTVAYHQIPIVRSDVVTLRWNIQPEPEWVRYGTSLDTLGQKQPFRAVHPFSLTPWSGLKTIYAELSTGERYYLIVLVDRVPPSFTVSWLGNASVTRPGGEATLVIRAQDNLYPASALEVSVNGGPWQPYQYFLDVHLPGQGMQEVVVLVRDPAGNIAIQGIPIFVLP